MGLIYSKVRFYSKIAVNYGLIPPKKRRNRPYFGPRSKNNTHNDRYFAQSLRFPSNSAINYPYLCRKAKS